MGQITISVNEQNYTLACRDGEEARLGTLGEYVDTKVSELTDSLGQVGEQRTLLMAALLIADELHDAMDRLAKMKSRKPRKKVAGAADDSVQDAENEARLAAMLSDAAAALEGIAADLETNVAA